MLDRKATKVEVKGILSSESRGAVFLAVLLLFVLYIVYFAAVWVAGQFFPVDAGKLLSGLNEAVAPLTQRPTGEWVGYLTQSDAVMNLLNLLWICLRNILIINLIAFGAEIILTWPLNIASQKFHLRLIRRKEPSALLMLIGYTPRYFMRSILLPIWVALCMFGWSLVMAVISAGAMALTAILAHISLDQIANVDYSTFEVTFSQLGWYAAIPIAVSFFSYIFMLYKSYSYSMSGMVLAERPSVGVRKSLRTSRMITRHNRWKLFVLDLSFIGWYLLVGLALALVGGVGFGLISWMGGQLSLIITLALALIVLLLCTYLLYPYRMGAKAAYYVKLKRQAITAGVVGKEDFRGRRELENAEPVQG